MHLNGAVVKIVRVLEAGLTKIVRKAG